MKRDIGNTWKTLGERETWRVSFEIFHLEKKKKAREERGEREEEDVKVLEFVSCILICFSSFSNECNLKFLCLHVIFSWI